MGQEYFNKTKLYFDNHFGISIGAGVGYRNVHYDAGCWVRDNPFFGCGKDQKSESFGLSLGSDIRLFSHKNFSFGIQLDYFSYREQLQLYLPNGIHSGHINYFRYARELDYERTKIFMGPFLEISPSQIFNLFAGISMRTMLSSRGTYYMYDGEILNQDSRSWSTASYMGLLETFRTGMSLSIFKSFGAKVVWLPARNIVILNLQYNFKTPNRKN